MRYRRLTPEGDYMFGRGLANFLIDNRECVAQSVLTRLYLWQGEWFLDQTSGTPWSTAVLGKNTLPLYDLAIRQRILGTAGVRGIVAYSSNLDATSRALSVTATIDTIFGQATITNLLTQGATIG